MSSIKIAELRPAGSELFQDSESFLNELSDGQEMDMVLGGGRRSKRSRGGNVNTVNTIFNTVINTTIINTTIINKRRGRRPRKH
ncbi:hypothetical protein BJP34_33335 [Moorena producens PAL-8-15-08-1]|uniref:Uncharacterized protein n=1 Tax=Moorena producens PAL-8-15-08-1 TaxID=1458985 RepID=A0A1D8U1G6_9CYAN|nr:hypothetical protein [Moorena producens]AOX03663.1 hypothetical protein BJP34_33335 [Moorena producens PAL-8-15-08-1]